jgi:hypothetical protein
MTSRLNLRIRLSYAWAQLISPSLSRRRQAASNIAILIRAKVAPLHQFRPYYSPRVRVAFRYERLGRCKHADFPTAADSDQIGDIIGHMQTRRKNAEKSSKCSADDLPIVAAWRCNRDDIRKMHEPLESPMHRLAEKSRQSN